jgi:hypothetical protein
LLAQNILTIEGLAAEPSKTLVEGLLDTERATEDPGTRRQLLGAAFHLKGKPRSHATTAVRKRVAELETGQRARQGNRRRVCRALGKLPGLTIWELHRRSRGK